MGPEGFASSAFTDKTPPAFDGHSDFLCYQQDVELWLLLTTVPKKKQGPALIGRLSGEAKSSAKTLPMATIASEDGCKAIITHLEKSYGIDSTNQLDLDLASFLDYCWDGRITVDQFVAGFHSRLDKIAELKINSKLKGHLLLRQSCLDMQARNLIVGAASGSYEVSHISRALRQAYRHAKGSPSMVSKVVEPSQSPTKQGRNNRNKAKKNSTPRESQYTSQEETFYTFRSTYDKPRARAIIDSGACTSVVGKETLDKAMKELNITNLQDLKPAQAFHRFGDNNEKLQTLFAVRFPLICERANNEGKSVKFHIKFDVIEGDLPFLIGLPSLRAMKACLNFHNSSLLFTLGGKMTKLKLMYDHHHVYLPFSSIQGIGSEALSYSCYSVPTDLSSENKTQNTSTIATSNQNSTTTESMMTHSSYVRSESGYYYRPSEEPPVQTVGYYKGSQSNHEAISLTRRLFDARDLRKLHLQLKHASKTQLESWIRSAGLWSSDLNKCIDSVLMDCSCKISANPLPHRTVSVRPPSNVKQADVSLDIMYFEGVPCLHVVCKATTWSETCALPSRRLSDQISAFKRVWLYRHGPPETIQADNEYNKQTFLDLCKDIGARFIITATEDHQANGAVESANRTLRSYLRRLRATNHNYSITELLAEATYGKNLNVGKKRACAFELLYEKKPRVLPQYIQGRKITSVSDQAEHASNQRLNRLLRENIRSVPQFNLGDFVFYWRDKKRWIGPARVIKIEDSVVTLVHGERTVTSSLNKIMKTVPPIQLDFGEISDTGTPSADDQIQKQPEDDNSIIKETSPASDTALPDKHYQYPNEDYEPHGKPGAPWIPIHRLATNENAEEDYKLSYSDQVEDNSHAPITNTEKRSSYAAERNNWDRMQAIQIVSRKDIPPDANLIGSHVIYKRKQDGRVKARIVPWGHKDAEKEFSWAIGEMDVTAAFLQAQGFKRQVYVRPPRDECAADQFWRLTAAAYGLCDSGRLWYLTSDAALRSGFGLTRSRLEPTMYYEKDSNGLLCFLLVAQVDNYVYAGNEGRMKRFERLLSAEFAIGELKRGSFGLYGCEISQDATMGITMTQLGKHALLPHVIGSLPKTEKRETDKPANAKQLYEYRQIVGQLLFIGRCTQPIMLRIASHMATKISSLMTHHLRDLISLVKCKPWKQEGHDSKRRVHLFRRSDEVVHPIHWSSRRLRRVARSSSTAEILAASEAVDVGVYYRELLSELLYEHTLDLVTDSRSVFALVSTTKEPEEKRNKVDLACMRQAFDTGMLTSVSWSPGHSLVSDALTKDNRFTSSLLLNVLRTGVYPIHADKTTRLWPNGE
eukprot:IDg23073t1